MSDDRTTNPLLDAGLLRAVLDGLPMRVFWKDRESRYLGANVAFARDAGVGDAEALVGQTDYDMPWKREEADFFRMVDRRVMESGNPEYHILEPIRMAGGQNAWLDTNKVPIRGADGEIVGILGTYEDVTARQGEGTELRADRDRLELVVSARTAELEVTTRQLREEISRREESNVERERLQEIVGVQGRAITELSTPVFPITDEILVVPLIGPIDELRAKEIMRTVLASISKHRARAVIIDIAAVLLVDGEVAGHLAKTLQAVRLKGARAIVSGISDAAAETLVELGIDWPEVLSVSDLRGGLLVALDSLGVKLGGVAHPRKRG